MNTYIKKIIVSILVSSFLPAFAFAQISVTTGVNVNANATLTTRLANISTRSNTAIIARTEALNNLSARIAALKNVSDTVKTNITNQLQTNIIGLATLKGKIDADTDLTTAQNDEKSILGSFRIYALVIPQGYIAAAVDRVMTISQMMTAVGVKIQARITADQAAGKNVTALQASLTDYNTKIADAQVQATAAQNGIAGLVPDGGDKTKLEANTTALKAARGDIKTASADLKAARKDAGDIIKGLRALGGSVNATSTTSVQQ